MCRTEYIIPVKMLYIQMHRIDYDFYMCIIAHGLLFAMWLKNCSYGITSAVLTHGLAGQLPVVPRSQGPMLIYECCVQHVF